MKHKFFTLFVLLALLLAGLPAQPAHAAGSTIYVDADSTCLASCGGSWALAYRSLQTALLAAGSGDQIWVAEGVYYPGTVDRASTFTLKNGVAVYGGFAGTETLLSQRDPAANVTTLSGEIGAAGNSDNSYHVVTGVTGATLDGFTITAGNADGAYPNNVGSGMRNQYSSPVLTNVTFSANSATYGGGMCNFGSSPILTDIIFSSNTAASNGGGMYNEQGSPTLTNVTFSGNSASRGGGMHNSNGSNPTLTNVAFSGNTAGWGGGMDNSSSSATLNTVTFDNNTASTSGGGMHNDSSNPSLTNVTFSGNSASGGGGMSNIHTSNPSLTDVTFSGNTATNNGGGMYNDSSNPSLMNVTFSNNTATNNGGGMFNYSSSNPSLTNVTFSGNTATNNGGGLYNYQSSPTLLNTLIANSTSGGDCFNAVGGSLNPASSHNLIEDSANACGLTNGVNGDIVGLDPNLGPLQDNGGFTLTHALLTGSPAIDAGNDTICPATDQRGVARPQGAHCDIGSYEFEINKMTFRSVGANDGWVLESAENSTTGGTLDKTATTFNLGDDAADKQYRAILHFDTADLPDNAVITKVTLKIKKQGLSGTDPFTLLGGLKVDMRKPFFGTAAGLVIGDFQAAAGKSAVATFGATPTNNWYKAVLNATGRAYVNLTGTTQFRLRFATGDNDNNAADYMKFFSGDYATASARPTLIIEYYVP